MFLNSLERLSGGLFRGLVSQFRRNLRYVPKEQKRLIRTETFYRLPAIGGWTIHAAVVQPGKTSAPHDPVGES